MQLNSVSTETALRGRFSLCRRMSGLGRLSPLCGLINYRHSVDAERQVHAEFGNSKRIPEYFTQMTLVDPFRKFSVRGLN
jgi:hypothetical protein